MASKRKDRIKYRVRPGKDGTRTIYARITLPFREGGETIYRRRDVCTRTVKSAEARRFAEAYRAECFENFARPQVEKPAEERTFESAMQTYILKTGQRNYLEKILDEIGHLPLCDVDGDVIDATAQKIYPGRSAATLNRQIYTPISAILRMAESKTYRPPNIKRPKGYLPKSNFKRPPKNWWMRVVSVAEPNLAAMLFFWRLHGRRTTEACRIRPEDVERIEHDGQEQWRVTVFDTKTDQIIVQTLAPSVIEQLRKYEWWMKPYIFGFSSRARIYPKLRAACARAGVPYHVPKDAGRHSFATYGLEQGMTLKEVQEAGRWKGIRVPAEIYGHLEHSTIDDKVRQMGEGWLEKQADKGEGVARDFGSNAGQRGTRK